MVLGSALWIAANSEYTRGLLAGHAGSVSLSVLFPCVPVCAPLAKKSGPGCNLLTVSRLVARKNHVAVLRVLAELVDQFSHLTYTILGNGPERGKILDVIQKDNLTDRVTLVLDVTDAQREAYYAEADIFVLPTVSHGDDVEGFGMVFLEAARHGLPVIAGRGGGVAEAVVDGVTGFLIDPLDHEALKRVLIRLIENREERERLGMQARNRVVGQFLCSARKYDLEKLYE